jgi:hypothetical protein
MQGLLSSVATSSISFSSYVDGLCTLFEQNIEQMSCAVDRRQNRVLADPEASRPHQGTTINQEQVSMGLQSITSMPGSGSNEVATIKFGKPTLSQGKQRRLSASSATPSQESLASTPTKVRVNSPPIKPCAVSCKTKLAILHDQSRRNGDIQRARLTRVGLELQQQRELSSQKDCLAISGAGRYTRGPIVI